MNFELQNKVFKRKNRGVHSGCDFSWCPSRTDWKVSGLKLEVIKQL